MSGGAAASAATADWTDGVVRRVLDNGLTLLVQRETSAPVVAVVLHVRAGYFDEPDEWSGISHVLEHMFFKGTECSGPGDLAREIKALGGYTNAGTIYDRTTYYVVLPSGGGNWKKALELQADALMNSRLDQEELSRELEVIIQEANRKLDNAPAVTLESLYALLYPDHPMGRWRIGTEEGLRRLSVDDLRSYYETRYEPSRVIVSIVGDIDLDETVSVATDTFAGWERASSSVSIPAAALTPPPGRSKLTRGDVQRAVCAVGWTTVNATDSSSPVLDVAAGVLGSGRSSWLYNNLRSKGVVTSISASHYTPTHLGVFDFFFQCPVEAVEQGAAAAMFEIEKLRDPGPSEQDIERVRSLLTTRRARGLESMEGRATALAHYEALGGYRLADTYWRDVTHVSNRDVRDVANRFLVPELACASVYLPRTFEGPEPGWPCAVAAPSPRQDDREDSLEPMPASVPGFSGAPTFLYRKRGTSGICTVGLLFRDMMLRDAIDAAGLTTLFVRSAVRGSGGLPAEAVNRRAEMLGGTISPVATRELAGWTITVRSDAFADAARLLQTIAFDSNLDTGQVEAEREQLSRDCYRLRDDMYGHPFRKVLEAAFAGTCYGVPALGNPESVGRLSADMVVAQKDRLGDCAALAVAIGDIAESEALGELRAAITSPPGVANGTAPLVKWTAGMHEEERDREQTALAMAFPAVPLGDPGAEAFRVLGAALGGMGGRLFRVLREERSLAYTVAAVPWLRKHAGALVTYIATSPVRENEAREAMLDELRQIGSDGIGVDEFEIARTFLLGQEKLKLQSSGAVLSEMAVNWGAGLPQDPQRSIKLLESVTLDDVVRAAARCFDPDIRAEYVVKGSRLP